MELNRVHHIAIIGSDYEIYLKIGKTAKIG